MRTWPRLVGWRLATDGVIALNLCSGSPNLSSESGCTCHSMFADRSRRIAPGEGAELRRGHRQRAGLEQQVLQPHGRLTEQRVHALVQGDGVTSPCRCCGSAGGRGGSPRLPARSCDHLDAVGRCSSAPGPMPESCRICGEPMAPAARITSRRAARRSPVTRSIPVARGPASPGVDRDAPHLGIRPDGQVRPVQDRPQERLGAAPAPAGCAGSSGSRRCRSCRPG